MAKRDLILHNFWWKVTSMLLAIIVWFVVYDTSPGAAPMSPARFPKHPLAIMRDSTDKRAIRITPTEVDVVVSTPIVARAVLTDADIQTFVDLSEVDPKTKTAPIRVYVPRGVRLEQILPDRALVEVIE
jgi:hypothetical protein